MRDEVQDGRTLVVDLDGTLVRTDMLLECFWAGVGRDWRTPFAAVAALRGGRAMVKHALAARAMPDPATLPYDPDVLDYISDWRAKGGRVALVSASDEGVVRSIAAHLGVFDEAYGSYGKTNLKGPAKARFLDQRFGAGGYAYLGDSAADLPVWRSAAQAITAGAGPALRAQVDAMGKQAEHIAPRSGQRAALLRGMRPYQWLKNILIFMPAIAAHDLAWATMARCGLAFVAFCLVASSVYLVNDLLDLAADRKHPRKRHRPLASGALPIAWGSAAAPALLVLGLALSLILGGAFVSALAGYFALTLLYSLGLKRLVVADIVMLSVLYTARIVAGGKAAQVPLSVWMLAFAIFFFLAMAAVKRQAELVDSARRGVLKAAGRGYRAEDLPLVEQMATAAGYVSVLVLALYIKTPGVQQLYDHPPLLWGNCLVLLYWISNMVMVTHRGGMEDDPILFALHDRTSRVCILLMLALSVGAMLG